MNEISIRKIQRLNWVLLLILILAGWLTFKPFIAQSIFIGGVISNVCFGWLKRDLTGLLSGSTHPNKVLFILSYYLRLAAIVAVLYSVIKIEMVHTAGLVLGLSTVVISIAITAITESKKTGLMLT